MIAKGLAVAAVAAALAMIGLPAAAGSAPGPAGHGKGHGPVKGIRWYHGPWPYRGMRLHVGYGGWGSRQNQIITRRITADQSWLAGHGVELTQWGPDPVSGKVLVYLTHYSSAAREVLIRRFGGSVVVFPRSMPRPVRSANRSSDSPPFFGGDFITSLEGCSSGPMVIGDNSTTTYMLTAGHCSSDVGDAVYTHTFKMGDVVNRRFGDNTQDVERVSGSYAQYVWRGGVPNANPPAYKEDGSQFPLAGAGVTNDSAYTGELRGIPVVATNQNVTFGPPRVIRPLASRRSVCQMANSVRRCAQEAIAGVRGLCTRTVRAW